MANKNYKHINLRFSAISEIKDQINLISEVREVLLYDRQTDRQTDGRADISDSRVTSAFKKMVFLKWGGKC